MKVGELMTAPVLWVGADETADIAARTMTQYNIGALPVCAADGCICGIVTDRDLVTRCLAAQKDPTATRVRQIMTQRVCCTQPQMEAALAAHLMGRLRVRRLPVVEKGKIKGIRALSDLTRFEESFQDAADALGDICENIWKNH